MYFYVQQNRLSAKPGMAWPTEVRSSATYPSSTQKMTRLSALFWSQDLSGCMLFHRHYGMSS